METWRAPGLPIILASQSPRRREILSLMGLSFAATSPQDLDELSFFTDSDLRGSLERLATAKAQSVASLHPGALVLGADTVVALGDRVMGKPASREEAQTMLCDLSGRRHTVMTGCALVCAGESFARAAVACTDVFFRMIDTVEIGSYLDTDEYRDKAGAYAIQGRALTFVESIHGCYYNVVGLPVAATIDLFNRYLHSRSST